MYYRLFILDKDENLITGIDLQAASDAEALTWASFVLSPGRIGELWCGTRCAGRAVPASDRTRSRALGFRGHEPAGDGGALNVGLMAKAI